MRLVLLRHGRTAWNAENRYQGHTDIPLDDVGRAQAEDVARRLAGHPFDLAASSPLLRARATAEAVMRDRSGQLIIDDGLKETGGGSWEGLTFTEIQTQWSQQWASWRHSHLDRGPLGGETPRQSGTRVVEAVTRLVQEAEALRGLPESVLVTAHGNCLRAATTLLTGMDAAGMGRLERLRNGAAIILWGSVERPGEWRITEYNV
ncbi:histidine phosphatase family protein [Microbacterium sp. A93]|uniref:histidine phosphatase family protein n=1 Tax=Microbacterium sp. A93 TaxID=3450716 RepID=UPI003F42527C